MTVERKWSKRVAFLHEGITGIYLSARLAMWLAQAELRETISVVMSRYVKNQSESTERHQKQ
jgi:hypothetical protein